MSLTPSISTGSTSSSNTNPPMNSNGHDDVDLSNRLYNDHQNYQTIFSNDSRFFDTSLHLYKSYRKLGYIQQSDARKGNKPNFLSNPANTLRPSVNGNQNHLKPNLPESAHHHQHRMSENDNGTLKPPLRRNNEHGNSHRSVSNPSKIRTSKILQETPQKNDDSDDEEPDIIITRL